jgi:4-hydroxy-tetrahydrodipicolinate synthase
MSEQTVFRGCYTAVITPFTDDAKTIDFSRLDRQLELQAAGGVAGVVVSGTTGESPTLSDAEYRRLVEHAAGVCRRLKIACIAGAGSNSTAHALELQAIAGGAGVDGLLSVNPYYNKPTQDGLVRHFLALADAAPAPIVLYNIPGRTGVALTLETIQTLAAHEKIVAIKDATGGVETASEVCARVRNFSVLSGDDPLTLPMASVGGVGVVSVVSNIAPRLVSELCGAFLAGKWDRALALHRRLLPIARALFCETNPIPVKAAMKLMGLDSGALRLPMSPPAPATVQRLAQVLQQAELPERE